MRRTFGVRFAAAALVAAGCGDDDDGDGGGGGSSGGNGGGNGGDGGSDAALVVGRVLPDTGPLAFLGPPMIEGTRLAIEDINAAGGVLGQDVELIEADEGDTTQTATESLARVLGEGANVLVGAASSGNSQEFLQQLSDQQIPQCSGSNTSPAFTDQENADYYVRTVPPDNAVAPIIADTVINDGHQTVAVVAQATDYGNALGALVVEELSAAGADAGELISYDPEATSFTTEVETIVGRSPDAVVIVSYDEGGQIVNGLLENGLTADQFYGSDGVFGPTFPAKVREGDPNVIDGMKVIGASGDEEFNARIAESTENNFIYGGQTYDCVIALALAAEAAGSTDGEAILEEIVGVTKEGTKCTTFEECKGLLEDGEDIDYDGASGAIDMNDVGDPSVARYAVGQFTEGTLEIISSQDVDLSEG
jgi:ABC-type branched-subunit amino acid transport system substrate-binding protein